MSRQHAETDVPELIGTVCAKILAVPGASPEAIVLLYLLANGRWYRFFIDEQVLFFAECFGPDPRGDLSENESYVDLASAHGVVGSEIKLFSMRKGMLTMIFSNGRSMRVKEDSDGSTRLFLGGE